MGGHKGFYDIDGSRARGSGRVRRMTVPRPCLLGQLPNWPTTLHSRLRSLTSDHLPLSPPPAQLVVVLDVDPHKHTHAECRHLECRRRSASG
jgi:hypothetical protein